jgi:hypothetical protein
VMKHSKKQLGACGDDARARGGASRLTAPLAQPDRTKVNPIRPVKTFAPDMSQVIIKPLL